MEEQFKAGLADRKDTSTDIQDLGDPNDVNRKSRNPGYHDVLPYLVDIASLLENEAKSDYEQAKLDKAVLYDQDPF